MKNTISSRGWKYDWNDIATEILNSGYHTIIAGTTGSGKSTMLDTFLYNLCQCEPGFRNFDVIDLKRVSVMDWKTFPHCQKYATTQEEAESVLEQAIKLMNSIYNDMEHQNLKESPYGYHYIIIDECADLVTESKKAKEMIIKLGRLGRAAHVVVILCTQAPSRKVLSADLVLNFNGRLALRTSDPIESRQIIGETGAELLPRYGKGIYKSPRFMKSVQVDINLTDSDKIQALREHWQTQYKPKRKSILHHLFK